MIKKKLRCGVIGTGYWGKFHAEKYAAMGDVELHGIADTNTKNGQSVANALNCAYYEDHRDLCANIDLVSVVVPGALHHKIGKDVLGMGVHCLMEKPLATTIEDGQDLVRLAKENSVVLCVGFVERYNPVFVQLQKFCKDPKFIDVKRLVQNAGNVRDVDAVLDLMIHDLDLVLFLMKSKITDVRGVSANVLLDRTDMANVHLTFENGGMANVSVSRVSIAPLRELRVFQKDIYITTNLKDKRIRTVAKDAKNKLVSTERECIDMEYDALYMQIRDFVDAVSKKKLVGKLPVRGEEALASLETAIRVNKMLFKH